MASLLDITPDNLVNIFKKLPLPEAVRLARTCKYLKSYAEENWIHFRLRSSKELFVKKHPKRNQFNFNIGSSSEDDSRRPFPSKRSIIPGVIFRAIWMPLERLRPEVLNKLCHEFKRLKLAFSNEEKWAYLNLRWSKDLHIQKLPEEDKYCFKVGN